MTSRITVVSVSHNSAELLPRFLQQLMEGRLAGDEVIVVDSGSDESEVAREVVLAAGARFVGLVENVGFGTASNVGASFAHGQHLAFVNPDVETNFHDLHKLASRSVESRLACVGPLVRDESGEFAAAERGTIRSPLGWRVGMKRRTQEVESIAGCCMVISSRTFVDVGGFDPYFFMFAEEIDLHRRIRAVGGRIGIEPEVTVMTEGGGSSANVGSRWSQAERQVAHVRYVRKWFGRTAAMVDLVWRLLLILRQPGYRPLLASVRQFLTGLQGPGEARRREVLKEFGAFNWE